MHRLDAEKFKIAKEAAEAEIDADRLAKEIAHSRRLVEEGGDAEGAMGSGGSEDEMLLKLKVYRMLGIDVDPDEKTGVYQRVVVRNRGKGDAAVVNIDPKFSRYFYANYLWGIL
jgi:kinetochore protein Spc24